MLLLLTDFHHFFLLKIILSFLVPNFKCNLIANVWKTRLVSFHLITSHKYCRSSVLCSLSLKYPASFLNRTKNPVSCCIFYLEPFLFCLFLWTGKTMLLLPAIPMLICGMRISLFIFFQGFWFHSSTGSWGTWYKTHKQEKKE